MAVETKLTLNDETVEQLQTLIRYNIDAHNGFKESAEEIDDDRLASLFRSMAEDRDANARELQTYVQFNGEEAEDDGSVKAAVHRAWINVRGKLNSGDPYVILIEAERGEDEIKEAYEEALKSEPGSAMSDVLHQQYARVKEGHDRIRDLRDLLKES